ncbi:calcium-binding protein [Rhodalgimonas zhirmunskyi]|uniref:Calcium-binding protein n=1 Tax=Rhodalgimonas zhirmunskyi TaxID=2964767 RepID=A0AAJ1U7D5_9RHOB|nr:calcium-binding protein [Rhodoalgimonas zhirmunskyi]MDQ2094355.1 hypothetical protein [Rhodoalgimonas zhirmunskyi]
MAPLTISGGFAFEQSANGQQAYLGAVSLEIDVPSDSHLIGFSASSFETTTPFFAQANSHAVPEQVTYGLTLDGNDVREEVTSAYNTVWTFDTGPSQLVSVFVTDGYTIIVPIGAHPDAPGDGAGNYTFYDNNVTGNARMLGAWYAEQSSIGTTAPSEDELTADEVSALETLWDAVTGVNNIYKGMTDGLVDFAKSSDAEFDGTAFDALLENSIWEQVKLYPGDYDPADMQALLRTGAQFETAQDFVAHVRNTELLGKIKVGTIADKLPDIIESVQTLWDGWKAIDEMLENNSTDAGYEALEKMLVGIVSGGVTAVITSSGAAVSIGGVLGSAGYASVVTVAGTTFVIGLGVAAVANEINNAYDVTGGISDLYRTALLEWQIGGGYGFGEDQPPLNITGDHFVTGTDGDDTLRGRGEDDVIYGSGGDDVLWGGSGADEMHGGTGNDTYYVDNAKDRVFDIDLDFFSEDVDTVYSSVTFALGSNLDHLYLTGGRNIDGTGNIEDNQLRGNSGENRLDGGRGSDLINGFGGSDVLIDGKGADTVIGGQGHDVFYVSNDNKADIFSGGAGTDTLIFQNLRVVAGQTLDLEQSKASGAWGPLTYSGIENVTGNAGGDVFRGNGQDNWLSGRGGNDLLVGRAGTDQLTGGAGKDTLLGGDGHDFLQGGTQNDLLEGGIGRDTLFGDAGNDTLFGDAGNDTLIADEGNDTLIGGMGSDSLIGGSGIDVARYSFGATTGISVDLEAGTSSDGDILVSIENVEGTAFSDTIDGGAETNSLLGMLGNDVIRGRLGNDKLFGGDGFDTLDGGDGNDSVWGGNGRDKAFLGNGNDLFFDNGQGGVNGQDTVYGNQGNDMIEGGAGNDEFHGDLDNDVIRGRLGNDKLFGGDGFDTLDGGDGNDSVWGGNGRDKAFLGNGNDLFFDNGQGGVNGQDTVFGGTGFDTIKGGAGNDVFYGDNGNDVLFGGNGDDKLYGGANADKLYGGDGTDSLWGGAGLDQMTGGSGLDTFFFVDGFGTDTVFGFDAADGEKISLAGVSAITGFTDLVANHLNNVGGTAQIVDGAYTILLNGVAFADVGVGLAYSADDFLF